MLLLQLAGQGGAGFFAAFQGGGIGAEFHPNRRKGHLETAIGELAFQQVEGLAAPAKAAKYPHRFLAVAGRQQAAQGRNDGGGRMAAEGGGADQHGITIADRLQQGFAAAEFTVEAVYPHPSPGNPLGDGIGDGGRVAIGTGVEHGHRQAGLLLAFPPAAVITQQTAPAFGDGWPMARGDAADRQFLEAIHHCLHLAGHGRHQAVVVIPAVFFRAAAVAFGVGVGAEMGGKETATHQQAAFVIKGP